MLQYDMHTRQGSSERTFDKFLCVVFSGILLVLLLSCGVAVSEPAYADDASSRPSVLILEAGLGDYEACSLNWLGDNAQEVAGENGLCLTTAESPLWWNSSDGNDAPATFLLGSPEMGHPIKAADIIWALDEIRSIGAQPKTFVVAMGATGLSLREYAEDMTDPTQSSRADLVGFAFCGTPQNGYAAMARYPKLPIWETIAQSVGLTADDLVPASAYLTKLNEGVFPRACRVLSIEGNIGDLGFGHTDGVATAASDYVLADMLTGQSETVTVNATIARAVNLTGTWTPFTSSVSRTNDEIDPQLCERLSAMNCYEVSPEVQSCIQNFYSNWMGTSSPVTHSSNVLALDLSGSMLEGIGAGETKLSAAKSATDAYLQTVRSYTELPLSAPVNVSTYGFNTSPWLVSNGFDDAAVNAANAMGAQGETNIGSVLQAALSNLENSPTCADRHILLLSDGASTEGMGPAAIMANIVPLANERGVSIDTVGFGDVGESNSAFLEELSKATGGSYYHANDAYGLKVAFLTSYYSSLGLNLVDKELGEGDASESIGLVDVGAGALQIGIVSEGATPDLGISCNGVQADESQFTVYQGNGIVSVQVLAPTRGDYVIDVTNSSGKSHLFAVEERGISAGVEAVESSMDLTLVLLLGAGVVFVALLVFVIVRARKTA